MALNKSILTQCGAIVTLNHDHTLDCILQSFVSKDFANYGNQLNEYFFTFENITPKEEENFGIRQLAYTKIKELDDWKQSTDC
jgi:hypothetical protein